MRSDATFERLVKLWISLWNLVLEEKRHLETVTASLQRIVFEEQGYPHFKNWPEICKLGETHHLMMMAVATADLTQRDERIEQLIAAFPQCFNYEEVVGPYPLSLIRAEAEKEGNRQGSTHGGDFPQSYDAVPGHIPLRGFDKFGKRQAGFEGPILPDGINPDAPQGSTVIWEGKEFVVLENNESCEELWIAPAECVRVDL